ncbi:unnamed protein product [Porites evermanni]|uniref:tRNA(Ile)-lysidine/2-thiocytidine synthase N-terminal domain-containing protein n=1 Tax=Porites evermanni TaxID=104178 RepID=A0ABN8T0V5_9CNID|nr:unnamed protein product [Porites evermanni]
MNNLFPFSGILIAKKSLFRNPVPSGCGGGSVFFVTENSHRYLKEIEMREEAGTPAIVGAIRAGLVFQLKQEIGSAAIMTREEDLCRRALLAWNNNENLVLLGNTAVARLPIFSFLIRHPISGLFLHHNFVCALLNDLFGIQARGGCACAGPYAQNLLGINEELAREIENLILEDSRLDRVHLRRYHEYSEREILRPGFVRLNLPYFMSDDSVEFVIKAVKMVAEHGWKLLPQYMFNPETGEWKHRKHQVFRDRKWLGSITYSEGHMTYPSSPACAEGAPSSHTECLKNAEEILQKATLNRAINSVCDQTLFLAEEGEKLRWFLLPSEAAQLLNGKQLKDYPVKAPFTPLQWKNGLCVPQGAHSTGAHYMESSVAPIEKCTTLRENTEERDLNGVTNCGCIAKREIGNNIAGISISSVDKCNNDAERLRDLPDSAEIKENQTTLVHVCNRSLEGAGDKPRFNAEDMDTELAGEDLLSRRRNHGKVFDETRILNCPEQGENTITSALVSETSLNGPKNDCGSLIDSETSEISNSFDQKLNLNTSSSRERIVPSSEGSETITISEAVCRRKPRKKKQNEVTSGKPKFHHPPKTIFKPATQALEEYEMIRNGDRVLVCLSGGKDSLSLLHTLHQYQFYSKSKGINFELGAATVDPQSPGYDPKPLVQYLAALGVPYFFEEQGIIQQAAQLTVCESICSFCSRMKRGRLYACARREGYNVLAMGQHLDDLAESFLMSAFHNGLLRTMKANYTVLECDLRVIRPLVYVREKELRSFAEKVKLPVIAENCPACFEAPKERHRTKQLLAAQEILFPGLYHSLLTAMKPLMARDRVGLESSKMKNGNYEDFL